MFSAVLLDLFLSVQEEKLILDTQWEPYNKLVVPVQAVWKRVAELYFQLLQFSNRFQTLKARR